MCIDDNDILVFRLQVFGGGDTVFLLWRILKD